MNLALLDTVVLENDLPACGLRRGDVGTVVDLYPEEVEAEFVRSDGHTQALITLTPADVRPLAPTEILWDRVLNRCMRAPAFRPPLPPAQYSGS